MGSSGPRRAGRTRPARSPRVTGSTRFRRLVGRATPRSEAERAERKRDGRRAWIGIVVAIVAIVPTLYQVYADSGPDRPEEFVQSCRDDHGLPAVPAARASEDGPWEGCSWPPAPGAADDGFYRLGVESRGLPESSYADRYTRVQIIESSCTDLLLQYRFDNQGTQAQLPPLRVANDQVVSGYDGSAENPYGLGLADPSDVAANGRLVVFKNDRYSLVRLECASPP